MTWITVKCDVENRHYLPVCVGGRSQMEETGPACGWLLSPILMGISPLEAAGREVCQSGVGQIVGGPAWSGADATGNLACLTDHTSACHIETRHPTRRQTRHPDEPAGLSRMSGPRQRAERATEWEAGKGGRTGARDVLSQRPVSASAIITDERRGSKLALSETILNLTSGAG